MAGTFKELSLQAYKRISRAVFRKSWKAAKQYRDAEMERRNWIGEQLRSLPAGHSIIDIGAGECQYKEYCTHLNYVSQDVAHYDGQGDGSGLQTGTWDFSKIDIVCDIYDIPEDKTYDAVLCTEVLEHIVDAPSAIVKFSRILKSGGKLIITAPFACHKHFAPHFYSSGYSEYFYRTMFARLGIDVVEITSNGSYFRVMHNELLRVASDAENYSKTPLSLSDRDSLFKATATMRRLIDAEEKYAGEKAAPSADLACYGMHVVGMKR